MCVAVRCICILFDHKNNNNSNNNNNNYYKTLYFHREMERKYVK